VPVDIIGPAPEPSGGNPTAIPRSHLINENDTKAIEKLQKKLRDTAEINERSNPMYGA
jgi:hypothetical protein